MRRLLPLFLCLVLVPVVRAEAVTIRDIVDLTRAGMSDEILLALIEVDGGVFKIDPATLTMLKEEGVSEQVIVAMVRSGRTRPVEEPLPPPVEFAAAPAPPPPVVVIEHHERQVPVPVAVPVYVPVYPRRDGFRDRRVGAYDAYRDGFIRQGERARPAQPVYWGFGGKLRPDAWQPAPSRIEGPSPHHADERGKSRIEGARKD